MSDYVYYVVPELETSRSRWKTIAQENGWYKEPFYVQVFVDPETNTIYDSVSSTGLKRDIIVYETRGEEE
jgi:hypothetical protein